MFSLKGIFSDRGIAFQLGVLITLLLIGYLIASVISSIFVLTSGVSIENIYSNPSVTRFLQATSTILMLFLPAIGCAFLCSKHPMKFLHIEKCPSLTIILLVTVSMFLMSPAISLISYYNEQIQLPDSMAAIEEQIQALEENSKTIVEKLLSDNSIITLFLNLFVIAGLAAITEEFFFRGTLYSIFKKKLNAQLTIWIIAFIFSAIHFQFYGFIPRMLLGAYLGYLLLWSKNIWIPIIAHFVQNATAVLVMSNANLKENKLVTGEVSAEQIPELAIIALIASALFILVAIVLKKTLHKESKRDVPL